METQRLKGRAPSRSRLFLKGAGSVLDIRASQSPWLRRYTKPGSKASEDDLAQAWQEVGRDLRAAFEAVSADLRRER